MNFVLKVMNIRLIILCFCLLCFKNKVSAHPMPYSLVNISAKGSSIKITIEVPTSILEEVLKNEYKGLNFRNSNDYKSTVSKYFNEHFNIVSSVGARQSLNIDSMTVIEKNIGLPDYFSELYIEYNLQVNKDFDGKNFLVLYDGIIHQDGSHYAILMVKNDFHNGVIPEDPQILGVFKRNTNQYVDPIAVKINEGSKWIAFSKMVSLGMHHILAGLDHLLFVVLLILIAPLLLVNKNWGNFGGWQYFTKRILKIITAFTIGHSLTLLVFTINDLNAFSKPIEISIALTIIITGFHAIKPIFYGKELLLTFIFGLIHGSAFGITLNEWGLTQSQKLLSLFGFNIGIEIMQVLIVLVCLPMVFLSKYPIFKFIRWIIASLTIFISIFWVVERVTNKPNVVTQFIESLF